MSLFADERGKCRESEMVTKIVPKTHEHTFFFFSHKD
jgi:hypothetical protein